MKDKLKQRFMLLIEDTNELQDAMLDKVIRDTIAKVEFRKGYTTKEIYSGATRGAEEESIEDVQEGSWGTLYRNS